MMRKLKALAKMCCTCNTSPKLALPTSVMAVTLLVNVSVDIPMLFHTVFHLVIVFTCGEVADVAV